MSDRNFPFGSSGLYNEVFGMDNKMVRCEICGKYDKSSRMNTLFSFSESGKSILTLVCNSCVQDDHKLNKLIHERDNCLEILDKNMFGGVN